MERGYIKGLDGLRALGVLFVLIAHLWPRPNSILDYFHFGRFGVILFFVLSGFLIVGGLLNLRSMVEIGEVTKAQSLKLFYFRRALRIFPIYYLALFFFYFIVQYPVIQKYLLWHLFYLSNYDFVKNLDFGNAGHFWTLAVEEQFYLLVPMVVIFLDRQQSYRFIWIAMSLGLLAKIVTAYFLGQNGTNYLWNSVTHPLWGCLEGLCLGAMLAYQKAGRNLPGLSGIRKGLTLTGIFVIVLSLYRYIVLGQINQDVFYACIAHLVYAGFSYFLLAYVLTRTQSWTVVVLELPSFRAIGKISYGIYVYHYLAKPFLALWIAKYQHFLPEILRPYGLFIVGTVFSVFIASLSFILIEKPILRFKALIRTTDSTIASTASVRAF